MWRLLSFAFTFLIGRLNRSETPLSDHIMKLVGDVGRQLGTMIAAGLIALLGFSTFLADLLLSSNLRGEGDLRLSQVSLVALIILAAGLFGLYRSSSRMRQVQDLYRRPQTPTNPLAEMLVDLLREGKAFADARAEIPKQESAERDRDIPLTPPLVPPLTPPPIPSPKADESRVYQADFNPNFGNRSAL